MARILIVDDSKLARTILRAMLERDGHQVTEASDGLVALERAVLDKPDLVLMDLIMSPMSGFDVLPHLKEVAPDARVLIATADSQRSTWPMVEAAGARGIVNKPFREDQVLAAVRAVLKGEISCC
ncbi:MAG: response regulator [Pirellulales bacterium]